MKNRTKSLIVLPFVFLLGIILTGCAAYTVEDAQNTPYSVKELSYDSWTGVFMFSYFDEDGVETPLTDCGRENPFADFRCQSENKEVTFSYQNYKGSVTQPTITINGTVQNMDCKRVDYVGDTICLPTN